MLKNQKMKSVLIACFAVSATLASQNVLAGLPSLDDTKITSDALVTPSEFNLDDYEGASWAGKSIVGLDQVVDQIWTGYTNSANAGNISFTFSKGKGLQGLYNNPNYGFTAGNGLGAFSERQKDAARDSITLWDDLVAPSFVEKNGAGADIQFANSSDPAQAYAYYPEYGFTKAKGWKFFSDIFVADPALNWTNNWLGFNGYGATTLIHEIGHTLGLSHPGAYNGNGATTYADQAEYAQDSEQYSIMSYWNPRETGALIINWSTAWFYGNAQTPMLHDIISVQAAYGADPDTRAGDTVYGFNSTAGNDVFDFSKNPFPNVAIYDVSGNDTIDMSGFNASVFIDLTEGKFSSAGQAVPTADEVNANRADFAAETGIGLPPENQASLDAFSGSFMGSNEFNLWLDTGVEGLFATNRYNIAIAYGTTIENAVGGSQRDLLIGNEEDNVLSGNAGADVHVGGAGSDTFVFTHIEMGDEIGDFTSGEDSIDLSGMGFSYVGSAAFSNTAGELRYDGSTLMGDVDGDGAADLTIGLAGAALDAGDLSL